MYQTPDPSQGAVIRMIGVWIAAVFCITAVGMLPLFVYRIDLSS